MGSHGHIAGESCKRKQFTLAWLLVSLVSARGNVTEDWQQSRHHLSALRYENQHLPDLLGNMLNHQFTFPETALRKGVAYVGANYRLRRVVQQLLRSNNYASGGTGTDGKQQQQQGARPIKIALLGGSISWGQGASERGVTDWFSIFSRWVIQAFPAADVTLRNGCVPGTPSAYMVLCLEMSMDDDADLVFVEYALNDGFDDRILNNTKTKTYERLMRRILAKPHNPAVILMQFPGYGVASNDENLGFVPFHRTMEDNYGTLAQYYDLQYLSFRTAVYHLALKKAPGYRWRDIMDWDLLHCSDPGFRLMAELAIWLLQQTALDLLLRPFGRQDLALLGDALLPPLEPGNEAPSSALCLHQEAFQQAVANSSGFRFVNDGTKEKPKHGFVATEPGSRLTITVNTARDESGAAVSVSLAYLRSYLRMGQAVARCESGCVCADKSMDAHHSEKNSQMHLALLDVTQARRCVISVTVLATSTSPEGGHKFKVGGVMVAEQAAGGDGQYRTAEGEWGAWVQENPETQLTYSQGNAAKPALVDPIDTEELLKQLSSHGGERQAPPRHLGPLSQG